MNEEWSSIVCLKSTALSLLVATIIQRTFIKIILLGAGGRGVLLKPTNTEVPPIYPLPTDLPTIYLLPAYVKTEDQILNMFAIIKKC